MLITKDTPAFEIRKGMAFRYILKESIKAQEAKIRIEFNEAQTDAKCKAAIEVAESLGFNELAADLRADFLKQTGEEA